MSDFKLPSSLPQDLLLIHDLVGTIQPILPERNASPVPDDIDSSGSESENEVEADLLVPIDVDDDLPSSHSEAEDSDSDSDSDDQDVKTQRKVAADPDDDGDDDDEFEASGPQAPPASYFKTKNEVSNEAVVIPDIEQIDEHEQLEFVGEIINVMDQSVIVRGAPSQVADRGAERALDSDTLLVFDDRSVLGYIYETFGPTSQPLYHIRFGPSFPLRAEKVHLDKKVFHVPQRSHFVFIQKIKAIKGSDASNVHDEEPAEEELEFSDDEAEAAHRRMLKQRRSGSRAESVASSRHTTPSPFDQKFASSNPYDEYGPYDFDSSPAAGSSRPMPIPYDDPYAEEYHIDPDTNAFQDDAMFTSESAQPSGRRGRGSRGSRPGRPHEANQTRGRGRRQNGRPNRPPRGRGGNANHAAFRNLSPTSLAIARATGQDTPSASSGAIAGAWGTTPQVNHVQPPAMGFQTPYYPAMHQGQSPFDSPYQQPYIQPHINPRFVPAFGFNLPPSNQQASVDQNVYPSLFQSGHSLSTGTEWSDQWTVPIQDPGKPK